MAQRIKEHQRNLQSPWSPWLLVPLYPKLCMLCLAPYKPAKERHPLWINPRMPHVTRHTHWYRHLVTCPHCSWPRMLIWTRSRCISICYITHCFTDIHLLITYTLYALMDSQLRRSVRLWLTGHNTWTLVYMMCWAICSHSHLPLFPSVHLYLQC